MQNESISDHLYTRLEAATLLRISPRKLDQLTASGELPRIKIGSAVRFSRDDLDSFITASRQGGGQ